MRKLIVFEKLSILNLIYFQVKNIFRNKDFFYLEIDDHVKFLGKIFKFNISKFSIENTKRDINGCSLIHLKEIFLYQIIDNFLSINLRNEKIYNFENDYWKKLIGSYYNNKLSNTIEKILIINNKIKEKRFQEYSEYEFAVNSFPNYNFFRKKIKKITKIKISRLFNIKILDPFPLRMFQIIYCTIISKIFFLFRKRNLNIKPKVYEKLINNIFDRYPNSGHLFWHKYSEIPNEQVVLFNDNKLSIPKKNEINKIRSMGFVYKNLLKETNSNISISNFLKVLTKVIRNNRLYEFDFMMIKIYLIWRIESYRAIIIENNVKIVHQYEEFSPEALSKCLALKLENGVFFWNHWSVNSRLRSGYFFSFSDVILSWGKNDLDFYKTQQTNYDAIFLTGLIAGDNLGDKEKSNCNMPNTKYKICLFDTSHSVNGIHSTTDMIKEFYLKIFNFISDKKDYGLIIKPKNINSFNDISLVPELKKVIDKYKSDKRIVILDSSVSPSKAAKMCDLCISFDLNTAGYIAALTDTKSIFINISKMIINPLYDKLKNKKMCFSSLDEFFTFFKNNKNLNSINLFDENLKNYIDSFMDNNSTLRSGEIIKYIFRYLCEGKSTSESIILAGDLYKKKWGNHSFIKQSNHEESSWNNSKIKNFEFCSQNLIN